MAVEEIKSIFRQSMKDMGLDERRVKDEHGEPLEELTLFAMANEMFWLPRLALRANEISQYLFNAPCFDVVFKYDDSTASGISIDKPSEVIKSNYGYAMFPAPISETLKQKVTALAIKHSIAFDGEYLLLKDNLGMYEQKEGDKYLRPLVSDSSLVVSMWMSMLPELDKAYERSVVLDANNEMSP